jgi:hypothetical protein
MFIQSKRLRYSVSNHEASKPLAMMVLNATNLEESDRLRAPDVLPPTAALPGPALASAMHQINFRVAEVNSD